MRARKETERPVLSIPGEARQLHSSSAQQQAGPRQSEHQPESGGDQPPRKEALTGMAKERKKSESMQ